MHDRGPKGHAGGWGVSHRRRHPKRTADATHHVGRHWVSCKSPPNPAFRTASSSTLVRIPVLVVLIHDYIGAQQTGTNPTSKIRQARC
jgi:hypothetical protein